MSQILACLDSSAYADGILDLAAWAANRLDQGVELLHVIQRDDSVAERHDHSGAVGLGAKSKLLEELASLDEQHARLERERGNALLRAATEHLEQKGVSPIVSTHRHGGVLETVVEREADASLVVVGKRGESSQFAQGHLGSQLERIVRASIRPVLVARPEAREPQRIFLCFDDGSTAWEAVDFIANSPLLRGLETHVAMAGHKKALENGVFERLHQRLPSAHVFHLEGAPETALPEAWTEREADLVLMGAYGHSPLRRLIVGSTTTLLLRAAHVPVLVFR